MKHLDLSLAALALVALTATAASADPPAAPAPGVLVVPVIVVHGRPNRPMVNIVVRTPTAADAAGAAHDRLRLETLARSEPATLTAH